MAPEDLPPATQPKPRQAEVPPPRPSGSCPLAVPTDGSGDASLRTPRTGLGEDGPEDAVGSSTASPGKRRPPRRPSQLIDRLVAGEPAAYEDLLREHGPRLFAVARRYLRRTHDAEDAVQDALLNVVKSISTFKRESQLATWLHRIVVNCALMRLRTQRRKPHVTLNESIGRSEADPSWRRSSSMSPHEVVVQGETERVVKTAISHLPPRQRQILVLRDLGTLETKQVAEVLDIGTSTVKVGSHRARQGLKSALDSGQIQDARW